MKKSCVVKVLRAISEIFLHENNPNYQSYRFICKFSFILFLFLLQTKNKNQVFSKLVVWYRAIFLGFCLRRVALYFKAMPNSIDFYKVIFLHVIRVRIVVSWNEQFKINKVVRCFNLIFSHVVWMAYHHVFTHVMSLADKILFYKLGKDILFANACLSSKEV